MSASALGLAVDPRCGAAPAGSEFQQRPAAIALRESGGDLLVIGVNADRARGLPAAAVRSATPQEVAARAAARRRWLREEILSLTSRYPVGERVADISKWLGRSPAAIYGKARRLGLSRPQRKTPVPVVECVLPERIEMPLPVPALDLVAPTPANPPFLPPTEALAPVRKPAKTFHLTPLGGRQTVWSPELVRRLILLWVAGFHHTVTAEVLDLTPCGVSSKAVRISLPYRGSLKLSKDVAEARRVDAMGGAIPAFIVDGMGRPLIGKTCNLSGIFFFGSRGTHTSVEAKLTLHYDRMRQAAA